MKTSFRLLAGLLFAATLTTAAGAQQLSPRQQPQQVPPTGADEAVQLTPEQIEGLITLEAITSRSTAGLTFEHRSDGTVGLDLQGRFQNVMMATPGPDGRLEVACYAGGHSHPAGAALFPRFQPVKGETAQLLKAPSRLPAPIRVTSRKTVAPEVK